ncbi:MAG: hypothetical protein U0836_12115 [Pirellulales bacterium]
MNTERLVEQFVARTLPKSEWTHHAHLQVGLWHVLEHGPDDALRLLRGRIRAYNEATGGVNSDQSGYHETITRFYVQRIAWFLRQRDAAAPIDELAEALIAELGDKRLLREFYSRERFESAAARREWVEPDLRPLE